MSIYKKESGDSHLFHYALFNAILIIFRFRRVEESDSSSSDSVNLALVSSDIRSQVCRSQITVVTQEDSSLVHLPGCVMGKAIQRQRKSATYDGRARVQLSEQGETLSKSFYYESTKVALIFNILYCITELDNIVR